MTLARPALRYWRIRISDDLRRERDDLHVLLLAELARHGSEDAGRPRLALFVDDDHRVLVEPDVAPVLTPRLFGRANNHGPRDIGFLHRPVGERVLYGDDDDVAQTGIAPPGSAQHADHLRRLRAGVIRHL